MVELIAFELWSHDMPNLVKLHGSWEEKSDKHRSRVSKILSFDAYNFCCLSDFYSILAMMYSMTVLTAITSTVSNDLSSVRCMCTVEQTVSRLFVLYIPTELTKEARQCLHESALQAEGKRTRTSCQEASNDKKQAMILEESALARISTEQKENDSPPKGNENGRSERPQ